jgi:hypothetical protein
MRAPTHTKRARTHTRPPTRAHTHPDTTTLPRTHRPLERVVGGIRQAWPPEVGRGSRKWEAWPPWPRARFSSGAAAERRASAAPRRAAPPTRPCTECARATKSRVQRSMGDFAHASGECALALSRARTLAPVRQGSAHPHSRASPAGSDVVHLRIPAPAAAGTVGRPWAGAMGPVGQWWQRGVLGCCRGFLGGVAPGTDTRGVAPGARAPPMVGGVAPTPGLGPASQAAVAGAASPGGAPARAGGRAA